MVLVRFFVLNKEVTVGPGRLCRLPYGEGEGNAHTLFYWSATGKLAFPSYPWFVLRSY